MANIKWSAFPSGSALQAGDQLVGLRSGVNVRLSGPISPQFGGTGVSNTGTLTLGGNTAFSGAFTFTGTITGNTAIIFPISGTLATTAQVPSLPVSPSNGGTGISNLDANTLTITGVSSINQDVTTTGTPTFTSATIGNLNLSVNSLISTNTNGNICFVGQGNNSVVAVGSSTIISSPAPNLPQIRGFQIARANTTQHINLANFQNTTGSAGNLFNILKSRSTAINSHTIVNTGDTIFGLQAFGDDGVQFIGGLAMDITVTGTPSTNIIPTQLRFYTQNSSGTNTVGMTLSSAQVLTLANALTVPSGGTGVSSTTAYAVLCGGTTSTSALQAVSGLGTSGQVLTSNGGAALPTWQAATSGGLSTWTTVAGTTQAIAVNNGYVSGNASQTTFTLPATAALGSMAAVEGLGAAGWILAANTGQTIKIGTGTTSSAGSLTSAASSDNVYVVCIVADTTWRVQTTNSNGLTIA